MYVLQNVLSVKYFPEKKVFYYCETLVYGRILRQPKKKPFKLLQKLVWEKVGIRKEVLWFLLLSIAARCMPLLLYVVRVF